MKFILVFIFSTTLCVSHMFAQISEDNIHFFDAKYGKDPELFKGIKYIDYRRVDFGHPFIYSENSLEGSLSYKGIFYENVILNYDVFEQVLLLTYKNNIGALVQLVLLTRYVDSFTIGNDTFIKNTYAELSIPFIRLFGDENGVQCIFTYEKDYSFNNKASESGFGYSDLIMKKYLLVDNKPKRLTRKNQLVDYLPENKKELCKAYLKNINWKFRQMNEIQIVSLCRYLNSNPNE